MPPNPVNVGPPQQGQVELHHPGPPRAPAARAVAVGRGRRRLRAVVIGVLAAAVLVAGGVMAWNRLKGRRPAAEGPAGEAPAAPAASVMTVKVVRPKLDPSFVVQVTQPAYVEPYFLAPLE